MNPDTQVVLVCLLFLGVVYVSLRVMRRKKLRTNAARILRIAAVQLRDAPFITPDEARETVRLITSFRGIAAEVGNPSDLRDLEQSHFGNHWRGAHEVLAREARAQIGKLGARLSTAELTDPYEIAAIHEELYLVLCKYEAHFRASVRERPDARDVITASKGFLDRYPALEQFLSRIRVYADRKSNRLFKAVTEK